MRSVKTQSGIALLGGGTWSGEQDNGSDRLSAIVSDKLSNTRYSYINGPVAVFVQTQSLEIINSGTANVIRYYREWCFIISPGSCGNTISDIEPGGNECCRFGNQSSIYLSNQYPAVRRCGGE